MDSIKCMHCKASGKCEISSKAGISNYNITCRSCGAETELNLAFVPIACPKCKNGKVYAIRDAQQLNKYFCTGCGEVSNINRSKIQYCYCDPCDRMALSFTDLDTGEVFCNHCGNKVEPNSVPNTATRKNLLKRRKPSKNDSRDIINKYATSNKRTFRGYCFQCGGYVEDTIYSPLIRGSACKRHPDGIMVWPTPTVIRNEFSKAFFGALERYPEDVLADYRGSVKSMLEEGKEGALGKNPDALFFVASECGRNCPAKEQCLQGIRDIAACLKEDTEIADKNLPTSSATRKVESKTLQFGTKQSGTIPPVGEFSAYGGESGIYSGGSRQYDDFGPFTGYRSYVPPKSYVASASMEEFCRDLEIDENNIEKSSLYRKSSVGDEEVSEGTTDLSESDIFGSEEV